MPEWDDELDRAQAREDRRLQYGLAAERRAETEILLEQDEHPIAPEVDELPGRKLLKCDIRATAHFRPIRFAPAAKLPRFCTDITENKRKTMRHWIANNKIPSAWLTNTCAVC